MSIMIATRYNSKNMTEALDQIRYLLIMNRAYSLHLSKLCDIMATTRSRFQSVHRPNKSKCGLYNVTKTKRDKGKSFSDSIDSRRITLPNIKNKIEGINGYSCQISRMRFSSRKKSDDKIQKENLQILSRLISQYHYIYY